MEPAQPPFFSEWTSAIHSRLLTQWEAWKNQDAAANDAVIMEDFRAFCPDGYAAQFAPLNASSTVTVNGNYTVEIGVYNEAGELVYSMPASQYSQSVDN